MRLQPLKKKMRFKNSDTAYGPVTKWFHWVIGLSILGLLGLGLCMTRLEPSPGMFKLYALHKSIGITVLFLAFLRLSWRLMGSHVFPLPNHQKWEKFLAKLIHGLLYGAMFIMPLSGWIMSSGKGFSVSVFNLFTLPNLVKPNDDVAHLANEIHQYAAYILIAMIGLHVAGALKHHLIDKDITLLRMLPSFRSVK